VSTESNRESRQSRRRQGPHSKRPRSTRRWVLRILLLVTLLVVLAGLAVGCSVILSAPKVTELNWQAATIIYDRDGNEIYRLHAGTNRTPVKLSEIPDHVVEAFLAIEDPEFREHFGLSLRGIARAIWRTGLYMLGLPGGRIEGGSTITQQLARDGWLTQDLSLKRKLQEAWVAIQLERMYTKEEILEMYLNQIYYGHGAYGIGAAARTFFGKEVSELTLAEGAQLAGMVNGPSIYDPYIDMEASLERRNLVLEVMLKQNRITREQYEQAIAEVPVLAAKEVEEQTEGNSFVDYVINILQDAQPGLAAKYGLNLPDPSSVATAGLKVYTTMDSTLQKLAEQVVREQMAIADEQYGTGGKEELPQAAMVVMDPTNGHVLAIVGGRDRDAMLEFNRATDALRQPGSAIKPLVAYAPAIEEAGLSPATILDDAPVMLSNDKTTVWPQNYNFKYEGLKPARYGIQESVNPMAVRALIMAGGPEVGVAYAHRFGLTTIGENDKHLALALGGVSEGTTLLDLTAAYAAIANMGLKIDPIVITRIEDRSGRVLFEATPRKQQVIKPSTAYLLIDMMKDVIRRGTAYAFTGGFKGWPVAGKTGTTEFNRDGWFIGFTSNLIAGVWNGYDNPENKLPWTGAFVPVKIWNAFMTQVVTERPADWPRPDDVVDVKVCRLTGALPNELCPPDQVVTDLFVRGTEPKDAGNILVKAKVVQVKVPNPDGKGHTTEWQLWQPGCGVGVERVFIKRPEPWVRHPTDPNNPKYIPADAKDELPTKTCTPGKGLLDLLFPDGGDGDGGEDDRGGPDKGNRGKGKNKKGDEDDGEEGSLEILLPGPALPDVVPRT